MSSPESNPAVASSRPSGTTSPNPAAPSASRPSSPSEAEPAPTTPARSKRQASRPSSSRAARPPLPPGAQVRPPYDTTLEVLEREAVLTPTRGSGPGGQRRNKVETGVRLVHPPSGVNLVATRRASREGNVRDAFDRLIQRLQKLNHVPRKRRPTRPSKAAKARRMDRKRRQSDKKASRRSVKKGDWS